MLRIKRLDGDEVNIWRYFDVFRLMCKKGAWLRDSFGWS
jgi:hypothetical protein